MSDKKQTEASNSESPSAIAEDDLENVAGGFSYSISKYSLTSFNKTSSAFPNVPGSDSLVDDDGQLGLVDDDGQLG